MLTENGWPCGATDKASGIRGFQVRVLARSYYFVSYYDRLYT